MGAAQHKSRRVPLDQGNTSFTDDASIFSTVIFQESFCDGEFVAGGVIPKFHCPPHVLGIRRVKSDQLNLCRHLFDLSSLQAGACSLLHRPLVHNSGNRHVLRSQANRLEESNLILTAAARLVTRNDRANLSVYLAGII